MLPKFFTQTLSDICTPDPSYIPDAKERSQTAYKIMVQVYLYIFTIFAFIIQMLTGTISVNLQIMRILCFSILLISLLIFCRTRLYIYYTILTLAVSLFPMKAASTGEVLIPTGAVFTSTIIVYMVTDKWYYYVAASMIHVINLIFVIKPNMERNIISMTPQEFSEKFIVAFSAQLCLMVFFLAPMHVNMRNMYLELKESKAEAEGALSHYKTFLFSFSHEIRNPINILLGSIELALQENLPKFALEMIETAKISSELLLQLINNVLDVGKAEVGKLEIVPTATSIHDLVLRMWNISSELMKKKGLCGYLKISRELPMTIEIDPDRLNQVLLNLIGNAVKFTERGSVNLTIDWLEEESEVSDTCFYPKPFEEEDREDMDENLFSRNEIFNSLAYSTGSNAGELHHYYVLTSSQRKNNIREKVKSKPQEQQERSSRRKGVLKITVTDQGCGMSKEAMKGLFKKFYQCSTEASQRKRGTGLGLYITKDICESMKGEIRVYSRESVGSVFMACLPSQEVENQY